MKLKHILPLTFSTISLIALPAIICSCGNQHEPDYTIRCDTTEITWSLSQTTETDKTSKLYTVDKAQFAGIATQKGGFGAYLHKEYDDKRPLGKNITPHFYGYDVVLSFTDLDKTVPIGNYWLQVTGLEYRDVLNVYSKNHLWFQFIVSE